ncbi:hypothetical protein I5Q34_23290 [Streptomyces sp. AV19]|uniref:DUF6585 family protein n=1 Tax=Streptomyces sp. AV19 TaxID=2793068 RepID=UPI0018FE91A5|nr:DUF6585 family protein [Streptomyces sp. AV19]MBH1937158.1 hypothetical protein [Streptomyces sp. AV19]MDG4533185.1 hypothetical protein [Streptomyces sp. AV19]
MTRPTPGRSGEELLLARISAAAGRERIGRRRATYPAAAHPAPAHGLPARGIRRLLSPDRYGRPSAARAGAARLDLYEHGMTIAVGGRIHVVRYDTTSVFRGSAPRGDGTTCTLTDVDGERVVLHGDAREWGAEVRRAVTGAQLPRALAALGEGGRVVFGDVWLTGGEVGSGEVSARWPQVRNIEIHNGVVVTDLAGRQCRLGSGAAAVPNAFVFCALVQRLHPHVDGCG